MWGSNLLWPLNHQLQPIVQSVPESRQLLGQTSVNMASGQVPVDMSGSWLPWSSWSICIPMCGGLQAGRSRARACPSNSSCVGEDCQHAACPWTQTETSSSTTTTSSVSNRKTITGTSSRKISSSPLIFTFSFWSGQICFWSAFPNSGINCALPPFKLRLNWLIP